MKTVRQESSWLKGALTSTLHGAWPCQKLPQGYTTIRCTKERNNPSLLKSQLTMLTASKTIWNCLCPCGAAPNARATSPLCFCLGVHRGVTAKKEKTINVQGQLERGILRQFRFPRHYHVLQSCYASLRLEWAAFGEELSTFNVLAQTQNATTMRKWYQIFTEKQQQEIPKWCDTSAFKEAAQDLRKPRIQPHEASLGTLSWDSLTVMKSSGYTSCWYIDILIVYQLIPHFSALVSLCIVTL